MLTTGTNILIREWVPVRSDSYIFASVFRTTRPPSPTYVPLCPDIFAPFVHSHSMKMVLVFWDGLVFCSASSVLLTASTRFLTPVLCFPPKMAGLTTHTPVSICCRHVAPSCSTTFWCWLFLCVCVCVFYVFVCAQAPTLSGRVPLHMYTFSYLFPIRWNNTRT